jgi:hypothetical protein
MAGLRGKPAAEWLEVNMLKVNVQLTETLSDQHGPKSRNKKRIQNFYHKFLEKIMNIT